MNNSNTYQVTKGCYNCGATTTFDIPVRTTVENYLREHLCHRCQCLFLIAPTQIGEEEKYA